MKNIYAADGNTITLGKSGENEARCVTFGIRDMVEEYGPGEVVLLHQRSGDAAPYPVTMERPEPDKAIWTISAADTARSGEGRAELRYMVGDTLAKSCVWQTYTQAALDEPGDVPEPAPDWVAGVLQAGSDAEAAAGRAEKAAKDVEAELKELADAMETI